MKQRSLFAIHDPVGAKLSARLWLKFSNVDEPKFCHNFKDDPIPMCDCGSKTETADYFFLCYPFFFAENRQKLLNSLFKIDVSLKSGNNKMLSEILLSGSDRYKGTVNKEILVHTINFCLKRKIKLLLHVHIVNKILILGI